MRVTREQVIKSGVRTLKSGYPNVNESNILTDIIYKEFFKSSLEMTVEELGENHQVSVVCKELIDEIAAPSTPRPRHKKKGD